MSRSALVLLFLLGAPPLVAAPAVSGFSPASGPASGGTVVTVTGSGFEPGLAVRFGAVAATGVNLLNANSLTAVAPPQEPGMVAIVVTNADGQSANKTGFTYVAVQRVSISSVVPATGSTAGGDTITIEGAGFQSGATVTVGGNPLFNVQVAPNRITGTTPSGPYNFASNAIVDIAVKNPDGSAASLGKAFTYIRPALAFLSLSPQSGSPRGGTTVTITGRGFTSALPLSVTFGGIAATQATVVNAFTVVASAPAAAEGIVDVVVRNGDAAVSGTAAFAYQAAPVRRRAM